MNQTVFYIIVKRCKTEEGKKRKSIWFRLERNLPKSFFFKKKGQNRGEKCRVFEKNINPFGWVVGKCGIRV
jgi:hypothetical protein